MTPHQNDTEENSATPHPAFDTLQEVGQWMVENDQVLSKLEDAIMAASDTDTPTQEFFRIVRELGDHERALKAGLKIIGTAIPHIEELKAKYGVT